MQKWEYTVEEYLKEYQLNNLGAEGWELVAVTCNGYGTPEVFYLKKDLTTSKSKCQIRTLPTNQKILTNSCGLR
jgi:hypothetical protein